ncbi:MAG: T9SS type A sorting domain-containing protein [Candidatus Delongbacteria bacterium]|nr:T9SS type A sorting domain-containing protein [Candidatus Delongbacteria bacterium]
MIRLSGFLIMLGLVGLSFGQILPVPSRPADAPSGTELIEILKPLGQGDREEEIYRQIIHGNVPEFIRTMVPVTVELKIKGIDHRLVYYTIPEYISIGSDDDYFYTPLSPLLGQRLAILFNCTMPTRKMVDQIYKAAPCKLRPQPIAPSGAMITVPVFAMHNDSVRLLRNEVISQHPLGTLVGGTHKDVIISNLIYNNLKTSVPKPVVIYGWHKLDGNPIQPAYNGHEQTYADYSHGIRLVQDSARLDDQPCRLTELMSDPNYYSLVSDEGVIAVPVYSLAGLSPAAPKSFGILHQSGIRLGIRIDPEFGVVYRAFMSRDGITFADSTPEFSSDTVLDGLTADSICYIRLKSHDPRGWSEHSEMMAAVPSDTPPSVLIVNGFERASAGNTYDFIRQHGMAVHRNNRRFTSATNEAVDEGKVNLKDFDIVDYILGDENPINVAFSPIEISAVQEFLQQGGKLIVSGSEIGWDLDYKGDSLEQSFCRNFLKFQYVSNYPGGKSGTYYQVEPIAGSMLADMDSFSFDNGTHGTYNVRYPDVLAATEGGTGVLRYSGVSDQVAAVAFEGIFPGGQLPGKTMVMGFPFETVYPEETRIELMAHILDFFDTPSSVCEYPIIIKSIPLDLKIYPNPFNPTASIAFSLDHPSHVILKVYSILGECVATLLDEDKPAGHHTCGFSATAAQGVSSGIYFCRLTTDQGSETRKMIMMK